MAQSPFNVHSVGYGRSIIVSSLVVPLHVAYTPLTHFTFTFAFSQLSTGRVPELASLGEWATTLFTSHTCTVSALPRRGHTHTHNHQKLVPFYFCCLWSKVFIIGEQSVLVTPSLNFHLHSPAITHISIVIFFSLDLYLFVCSHWHHFTQYFSNFIVPLVVITPYARIFDTTEGHSTNCDRKNQMVCDRHSKNLSLFSTVFNHFFKLSKPNNHMKIRLYWKPVIVQVKCVHIWISLTFGRKLIQLIKHAHHLS